MRPASSAVVLPDLRVTDCEAAVEWSRWRGRERAKAGFQHSSIEDGAVHALHAAIGLWAAGLDEAVLGAELGDGVPELGGAELGAVVAHHGACPAFPDT